MAIVAKQSNYDQTVSNLAYETCFDFGTTPADRLVALDRTIYRVGVSVASLFPAVFMESGVEHYVPIGGSVNIRCFATVQKLEAKGIGGVAIIFWSPVER